MDISASNIARLYSELTRFLPAYWQRKRGSLRPAQVLYSIISMVVSGNHGYAAVLDHLKRTTGEVLGWDEGAPPCPSSFSEARRKLSAQSCVEAFAHIRSYCSHLKEAPKVGYGDFRLLAVDMTTLALPAYDDIAAHFGSPKNRIGGTGKGPKATLTALWDISTNSPVDWRLERCYASERFAAYDMIEGLVPGDLLIADRGYPSFRMLHSIHEVGAHFLIRLPTGERGGFREARQFAGDELAWDHEVVLREPKSRQGGATLSVRLIKKRLGSGQIAVFATNLLSKKQHRRQALCDLYCYRWDIETAFKEMKVWHGLERFHARYADGIYQEVSALMIFMTLTAELELLARNHHEVTQQERCDDEPQEPEIRFNRKRIAEYVVHLLIAAAHGPKELAKEYEYSMRMLWRHRQKRKPGRKFDRVAKSANSKWKRTTYNTNVKRDA